MQGHNQCACIHGTTQTNSVQEQRIQWVKQMQLATQHNSSLGSEQYKHKRNSSCTRNNVLFNRLQNVHAKTRALHSDLFTSSTNQSLLTNLCRNAGYCVNTCNNSIITTLSVTLTVMKSGWYANNKSQCIFNFQ